MAWGTTVLSVKTALTAMFDAALDITVMHSRGISSIGKRDVLIVGYQSEDVPSVEGRFTVEKMGATPYRDTYTVHNRIGVVKGSGDILKAEARAFALLAGAGATLAANPTLGVPAVMLASPGAYSLIPSQDPRGGVVVLQFDVDIDAFTTV